MRKAKFFAAMLMAMSSLGAFAQHQFSVQANKPGVEIQPTMYGIFFENINFGADGGLYAEMVENRSFEFPQRLMGWNTFGNVTLNDVKPAFDRNPHYVTLESAGAREKQTGLENRGFFGMGLKKDMKYDFSVYGRLHLIDGKQAKIRVELVNSKNDVIAKKSITITNNKWQKHTASLTSPQTDAKGLMRVYLEKGSESVDLDHISLFPSDNWNGLRADLVQDLADLKPGIFRFPGGCIVEGTDLDTRYEWKNSVGNPENRPLNENRWRDTFPHRLFPNYYQSLGLGFYEYFLLSEKIGAEPLPILSVGLACQYQNSDKDPNAHVAVKDLQSYIDDELDLIEFANGPVTSKWGKLLCLMNAICDRDLDHRFSVETRHADILVRGHDDGLGRVDLGLCQHGIHRIKMIRNPVKKLIFCISHRCQFISIQLHRSTLLQHHNLIFNQHPMYCRENEIFNQTTRTSTQIWYYIHVFSHINNSIP